MNFSVINKYIGIVCLLLASISCLAQKKSNVLGSIEDTLTYKQGNEKISRILIRNATNYKQLYEHDMGHYKINENDWTSLSISDTICYKTEMKSLYIQKDDGSFERWLGVWDEFFSRYLGNAFWSLPQIEYSGKISLQLEKGKSGHPYASVKNANGGYTYYKIKCTKAHKLKTDTTHKLCVFKFYRYCILYTTKKGEYKKIISPFPSGKITYLHNVGFIAIKFPKDKMLRLKLINGYPWKEYVNKINPNYRYFGLTSKKYLQ